MDHDVRLPVPEKQIECPMGRIHGGPQAKIVFPWTDRGLLLRAYELMAHLLCVWPRTYNKMTSVALSFSATSTAKAKSTSASPACWMSEYLKASSAIVQ